MASPTFRQAVEEVPLINHHRLEIFNITSVCESTQDHKSPRRIPNLRHHREIDFIVVSRRRWAGAYSMNYPIPFQEVDNAFVTPPGLRVSMGTGNHPLSSDSQDRLSLEPTWLGGS
ncbi:hypothetical protein EVAR_64448_1 [Eumeta japonica]|uniref:Uncharacterized protein n=1 Tax=Eumeta variegata TaxID=151549 RepID=A0A4C1YSP5_EUMVA|nr:hypothetical protein EVAR_64448_1 [Eumeta japonica]